MDLTFTLDDNDEGQLVTGSRAWSDVWLPVLGPSSIVLVEHVARRLSTAIRYDVVAETLFLHMGLAPSAATNSPGMRTLSRLVKFNMLASPAEGSYVLPIWSRTPTRSPLVMA